MMKILLATDGSETAKDALDYVLQFPFPKGQQSDPDHGS